MLTEAQTRKINFVLIPVFSVALGYLLFPLVLQLVNRTIYVQTSSAAQIWMSRNQHDCLVETNLGPMLIGSSLPITMIAVTVIVYFLADLLVLAKQVVAYEEVDKLAQLQKE